MYPRPLVLAARFGFAPNLTLNADVPHACFAAAPGSPLACNSLGPTQSAAMKIDDLRQYALSSARCD
jgi:hypothetical protein